MFFSVKSTALFVDCVALQKGRIGIVTRFVDAKFSKKCFGQVTAELREKVGLHTGVEVFGLRSGDEKGILRVFILPLVLCVVDVGHRFVDCSKRGNDDGFGKPRWVLETRRGT